MGLSPPRPACTSLPSCKPCCDLVSGHPGQYLLWQKWRWNHRITELFRLEKSSKIEWNCYPSTAKATTVLV